MGISLEELEKQKTRPKAADTDDFEGDDIEDVYVEKLEEANDLFKRTSILLMFLSDPVWTKNITKRERAVMDKAVDEINVIIEEIEEMTAEAAEDKEDS